MSLSLRTPVPRENVPRKPGAGTGIPLGSIGLPEGNPGGRFVAFADLGMQTGPVPALLSRAKAQGKDLGTVILRLEVGIWRTSPPYGEEDLPFMPALPLDDLDGGGLRPLVADAMVRDADRDPLALVRENPARLNNLWAHPRFRDVPMVVWSHPVVIDGRTEPLKVAAVADPAWIERVEDGASGDPKPFKVTSDWIALAFSSLVDTA